VTTRSIILIDEEKCNGCGNCITACAEGALQLVDGKAKLVSDVYCDGLGACIGDCPEDALTIIERAAEEFDEEAVKEHLGAGEAGYAGQDHEHSDHNHAHAETLACGCPGSTARELGTKDGPGTDRTPSQLTHWPVQLHLVNPVMPFFKDSDVLITADCVPVAYGSFHADFLSGNKIIIACPKLDDTTGYVDKIADLIDKGGVRSIKILHMEVPCCFGLNRLVQLGAQKATRSVPIEEITVGVDGTIKA
jgi:Pyruvate/2-oxoacid:ferredoxin oxidoreductase delta subunit